MTIRFKFILDSKRGEDSLYQRTKNTLLKQKIWRIGECVVQKYVNKKIYVYLGSIKKVYKSEIESIEKISETIAHEYIHSILDKLEFLVPKQEETIIEKMGY